MPKPTERAIKRKPMALVFLAWKAENIDADTDPQDRDFEWFETDKGLTRYSKEMSKHFSKDVADNEADQVYLMVQVTDTQKMTLGEIAAFPDDEKSLKKWAAKVKKDATLILAPAPAKKATPAAEDGAKKAPAKKTAKKSETRKASETSASEAPKPKKKAAKKAPVKKGASDKSSAPTPRAAKLKQRLAEKKSSPSDEVAALDKALAEVSDGPDAED